MNKKKAVLLKKTVLIFLLFMFIPAMAGAFSKQQPAYISSFYLCNKLIKQGNILQPETVVNALVAENPNESAYVVIDFIGIRGTHTPEVEILDSNGKLYSNNIKLDPVTVNNDRGVFRVTPRVAGRFPQGGVFFKVSDTLDSGSKKMLGIFGVVTVTR